MMTDASSASTALLQVDVSDSTGLLTRYTDTAKAVFEKLRLFLQLRIVNIYSGRELTWNGDGGVYSFSGLADAANPCRQAILAAIEIRHSMVVFNTFLSHAPFDIHLRVSIDFQAQMELVNDASSILDPRFSWFLKNEREITRLEHRPLRLTEEVLPHIGELRGYCKESHSVDQQTPAGRRRPVQIYSFDTESALETEHLFALIHNLKKKDISLFKFLDRNEGIVIESVDRLYRRGNWRELVSLREYLSHFFETTGRYSLGIDMGEKFLRAAEVLSEPKSLAWIYLKDLGWLRLLREEYDLARVDFEKAFTLFRNLDDREGLCYYYRYMSVLYYMLGDYAKAGVELKTAREVCDTCLTEKQQGLRARLLNNEGRLLFRQGLNDDALLRFEESLNAFESANDQDHSVIVEINIAEVLISLNKIHEAESMLMRGLIGATEAYWHEGSGRAKYFLALIFKLKKQLTASKVFALEADYLFRDIGARAWAKRTAELLLGFEKR
jgi:tetratricopeptide (TPR) repeat protein